MYRTLSPKRIKLWITKIHNAFNAQGPLIFYISFVLCTLHEYKKSWFINHLTRWHCSTEFVHNTESLNAPMKQISTTLAEGQRIKVQPKQNSQRLAKQFYKASLQFVWVLLPRNMYWECATVKTSSTCLQGSVLGCALVQVVGDLVLQSPSAR